MKGSLFFDMINVCVFFTILLGLCTYVLTAKFSPKEVFHHTPITDISAQYTLSAVDKTMNVDVKLENHGETKVVLVPSINYDSNLIKLNDKLNPVVLNPNETKCLNLSFTALYDNIFCKEGKENTINLTFKDVLNDKNISLEIKYKIRKV